MTTWRDGGNYSALYREIVSENGSRAICLVRMRHVAYHAKIVDYKTSRPCPQGEANFNLILKAPQMLEALRVMLQAMNEILRRISYQETVASQLGDDVFKQVMHAIALAQTVTAAVKGEDNGLEG